MIGAEATVRSEMMAETRADGALGFARVKMHLIAAFRHEGRNGRRSRRALLFIQVRLSTRSATG